MKKKLETKIIDWSAINKILIELVGVVTLQFLVEKKSLGIALNLQSCSKLVRIE